MSFILGVICLALISSIPIVYAHIMKQSKEIIDSEEFKAKYGAFYDSISTRNSYNVSYNMVFVLRRTLFCFSVFAVQSPAIQFLCIYLTNILYNIYFFYHLPKENRYL